MRLIDADKLRQRLNPDDWGTPDERWRPEREFGELIDNAPTVDQWHYPSKGELPPKWGFYLVTLEYSDKRFVTLASWHELERKWHGFNGDWYNPIAWMPLLEPPKEEE